MAAMELSQTVGEGLGLRIVEADEGRKLLDRESRRLLDMSAEEFAKTWNSGGFNGSSMSREVIRVSMLLRFAGDL